MGSIAGSCGGGLAGARVGRALRLGDRLGDGLAGAAGLEVPDDARAAGARSAPCRRGCEAPRLLGDPAHLVQGRAHALERLADLARHDPHLVGVALGDLGHHLQVLVGQQRLVGLAVVDRLEHRLDGLALTLGAQDLRLAIGLGPQDHGLPVALGVQDGGLLVALGGEDGGLPCPLGGQDRRTLVAVGAHLLLHRVLDRRRRVDALELDPVDADPPLAGGLVQDAAQPGVDRVAAGERLLEVHPADDVAQRRGRELLDGLDVVGDLVGGGDRVGDLEVDDRVDRDHQVVLGDHGLRREAHHLLAQVDEVADPIDEGHHDVEAGGQRVLVLAEPLDDAGARLGHDPHRLGQHHDHEEQQQAQ